MQINKMDNSTKSENQILEERVQLLEEKNAELEAIIDTMLGGETA